jgi:cytochrome c551/c552
MVLVSGDVGWTLSEGKDLFRQRGCVGCHRFEGYDKEPEDLNSMAQQIKQMEGEKKENLKQAAYLMKQADNAQSNEEANHLNDRAVALRVSNSKLDLRIVQLDRSRAKPEGRPAEAQQELDSRLAEETDRFSSHDADAEFPAE